MSKAWVLFLFEVIYMATQEMKAGPILKEIKEWIATSSKSYVTVCIVGSVERVWNEEEEVKVKDFLFKIIYELAADYNVLFISGESPKGGVDIWVKETCDNLGVTYKGYPPERNEWTYYKKRNRAMAEACDVLMRVYNARTKTYGSGWTADFAERVGRKVLRVKVW